MFAKLMLPALLLVLIAGCGPTVPSAELRAVQDVQRLWPAAREAVLARQADFFDTSELVAEWEVVIASGEAAEIRTLRDRSWRQLGGLAPNAPEVIAFGTALGRLGY
jgi:hypothetical protein